MSRNTNPPPLGKKLIGFGEGARDVGVDSTALWRWARKGTKLSDGSRLYLEAWATPGAWKTTREAIQEFLRRLTEDRQGDPVAPAPRSPAKRARDLARVDRQLTELGV